jgi:DNA-binding transcriptional MocR family regulator
LQGCLISQHSPELIRAMTLLTTTHANTISTLYLLSLLSSPHLPTLLALNSERLTASYQVLAECLHKWRIEFVEPTHGLFVFARLTKNVRTMEQEQSYSTQLLQAGLKVSPGQSYRGKKGEFGWARIRFSLAGEMMEDAVAKLDAFFEQRRQVAQTLLLSHCGDRCRIMIVCNQYPVTSSRPSAHICSQALHSSPSSLTLQLPTKPN